MLLGSLFQTAGAAAAYALSPSVFFVFTVGAINNSSLLDLRE